MDISEKRTKSADKSCLYKQTFNINPLMGGFSSLGDTLAASSFNVYQFTGEYKIGASGNNVVLTTTSSCSQASVSFVRALVVFQQKVTPDMRNIAARCKQEVIFNENKYTMVISPFEQHAIDVGTMITASDGLISYTTFKLPSRTNQAKIAQALFDYLKQPTITESSFKPLSEQIKVQLWSNSRCNVPFVSYLYLESNNGQVWLDPSKQPVFRLIQVDVRAAYVLVNGKKINLFNPFTYTTNTIYVMGGYFVHDATMCNFGANFTISNVSGANVLQSATITRELV